MADRKSSSDDRELWNAVTSEVTPLRGRKARANVSAKSLPPDSARKQGVKDTPPTPLPDTAIDPSSALKPPKPSFPPLSPNTATGIEKRTVARLRRGQMPIDARLDLHGYTQREAHRVLDEFLEDARDTERRTVLVITGKGEGGQGVLREAVPRWLNEATLRPLVLAFSHAQPKDGGTGALYILLRRRR